MRLSFQLFACLICVLSMVGAVHGQNRDQLWLNYTLVSDEDLRSNYIEKASNVLIEGESETIDIIRDELSRGVSGLLDKEVSFVNELQQNALLIGSRQKLEESYGLSLSNGLGEEGFQLVTMKISGNNTTVIAANTDVALLYGTYHFLKLLQTNQSIAELNVVSVPKTNVRMLNHWDNLDRTSERGYAGFSIWDWHRLPGYLDSKYIDYARANASIGINGTALTNVNANALILTPMYLEKVKALADLFRPYGIQVYLTARFSAPMEIGGLETADPLNKEVQQWWTAKTAEIYQYIPDFGGYLVKANSEGQPGPQDYERSHADGANMLAEAVAPFDGIVMWRAFVYSFDETIDRAKQAYDEFLPLDDEFLPNVMVQIKNGPIDFQPREPFSPLFGALKSTTAMMEFQITQEYLGQATQWVYLGPMWEEVLQADTYAKGKGSTVAKVIDGSLYDNELTGMAGVANIGTDENWTGHPMAQANWYAYGRFAWDPYLTSKEIATQWVRQTFSNDQEIVGPVVANMLTSHEASVNYMTPLGLAHMMLSGHHYGPGPWIDNLPRGDWNPVYYHRADEAGIGFDRSKSGSDATSQYFPKVAGMFEDPKLCDEKYLLWFHHMPWDTEMKSGRNLWDELCFKYQEGIGTVREMQENWDKLEGKIDQEKFRSVQMLLKIQEKEAIWWKNACLLYFQTFSKRPFPEFLEKPDKTLEYYQSLKFPYAPGRG
ncbi:MAG: alpha-glucuronidase [Cyclobacteriaceae bacterium]